MEVQRKQILNQENLASLESWVQRTAIKLVQVNGQRKYGGPPPDWTGPAPGPGCEVFISQIPRDIYEDKLIPLFQSVGPLYEFRLMMNFSGQNRGFAYAKYRDPQSAAAAIRCLHQHQLQQGAPLTVRRSTEKRQLCLGDLPAGVDRERLLQVLRGLSEGVESVSLKFGKGGKKVTAIVHYTSHYNASMAKKVICEAFKRKFGIIITVKWFSFSNKPKQDEDEDEEAGEPFPATKGFPKPRDVPASTDAVALLLRVCEVFKVGPPLYDLQFLHAGANGFLYFAYRVLIPGLPVPFSGVAQILPGTSAPLLRGREQMRPDPAT
ncbi:hypothetical protein ANANG_G00072420 [Anguilla anguilla]|uniref:RRM domain-containing protein n=1 Tax=Anguilla anguilla TaxID=7936 RepID=A0A9D3MSY3_ANGAN|nr:hypothetical protein ANANG_G00072420 [Anguilla anguilla]